MPRRWSKHSRLTQLRSQITRARIQVSRMQDEMHEHNEHLTSLALRTVFSDVQNALDRLENHMVTEFGRERVPISSTRLRRGGYPGIPSEKIGGMF